MPSLSCWPTADSACDFRAAEPPIFFPYRSPGPDARVPPKGFAVGRRHRRHAPIHHHMHSAVPTWPAPEAEGRVTEHCMH